MSMLSSAGFQTKLVYFLSMYHCKGVKNSKYYCRLETSLVQYYYYKQRKYTQAAVAM
jgi:hypothetical protein